MIDYVCLSPVDVVIVDDASDGMFTPWRFSPWPMGLRWHHQDAGAENEVGRSCKEGQVPCNKHPYARKQERQRGGCRGRSTMRLIAAR